MVPSVSLVCPCCYLPIMVRVWSFVQREYGGSRYVDASDTGAAPGRLALAVDDSVRSCSFVGSFGSFVRTPLASPAVRMDRGSAWETPPSAERRAPAGAAGLVLATLSSGQFFMTTDRASMVGNVTS
jgi:hypothetical protein